MEGTQKVRTDSSSISVSATTGMGYYCFEMLHYFLNGTEDESKHPRVNDRFQTNFEVPLFITWEKRKRIANLQNDSAIYSLRGCIGSLEPRPLSSMKEYVYLSAFRDRRFSPITAEEVSDLRCSVSLLVDYELGENAYDWEVGIHGIIIEFQDKNATNASYRATYLPSVASEQGWTQEETIDSLVQKTGWRPTLSHSLGFSSMDPIYGDMKTKERIIKSIKLTRYKASKITVEYSEFMQVWEQKHALVDDDI